MVVKSPEVITSGSDPARLRVDHPVGHRRRHRRPQQPVGLGLAGPPIRRRRGTDLPTLGERRRPAPLGVRGESLRQLEMPTAHFLRSQVRDLDCAESSTMQVRSSPP